LVTKNSLNSGRKRKGPRPFKSVALQNFEFAGIKWRRPRKVLVPGPRRKATLLKSDCLGPPDLCRIERLLRSKHPINISVLHQHKL
jgi:hypothetical protein